MATKQPTGLCSSQQDYVVMAAPVAVMMCEDLKELKYDLSVIEAGALFDGYTEDTKLVQKLKKMHAANVVWVQTLEHAISQAKLPLFSAPPRQNKLHAKSLGKSQAMRNLKTVDEKASQVPIKPTTT